MSPQDDSLQQKILKRLEGLSTDQRAEALKILRNAVSGDGGLYRALWEADFEEQPPTIQQFLDEEEYLGKVTDRLFPLWRRELIFVFDPTRNIWEWIIRGAIGTGKTTAAIIALLYKAALSIHLRNPQEHYGLMEGHPIVFAFFNVFKYLSEDVGYHYFSQAMQLSPFFKRVGRKNKKGDVVGLPKNVLFAVGSEAAHALGQNILSGHLDEANYGRRVVKPGERAQVQNLYTATRDRIDSRYLQEGGGSNPGFLVITSSERDESDFLAEHEEKVRDDSGVHVTQAALWEAKEYLQTGKWFYVFAGDERKDPKVLEEEEAPNYIDSGRMIAVPDSPYFRRRFSYDLVGAIRNQAGVGTFGVRKLMGNRSLYWDCLEGSKPRTHPFKSETAVLGLHSEKTLVDYLRREDLFILVDKSNDIWKPIHHPNAMRAVHVDLAKNKDCAGISMGCLSGYSMIEKMDEEGHLYRTAQYRVWVDFMLQIRAEVGSEIDFKKIEDFVFYLKHTGFNIKHITYDSWQSTGSLQLFKKARFNAKELSVDKKRHPYDTLKNVIYEGRLDHYKYQTFIDEMFDLEDLGKKIDHPKNNKKGEAGSKDVSDAVCGVVFCLLSEKGTEHTAMEGVPAGVFPEKQSSIFEVPQEILRETRPPSTLDEMFDEEEE